MAPVPANAGVMSTSRRSRRCRRVDAGRRRAALASIFSVKVMASSRKLRVATAIESII